jgi:uncharacterized membrane protein
MAQAQSTLRAPAGPRRVTSRVAVGGVLLGIGLGGFLDGIVLHQVLQWHHMLTSHGDYPATTVAGLETNTLWDGLFHLVAWLATVAGVVLLWRGRAASWPARLLTGLVLAGWGAFNLVEGTIDHHLLTLHHVRSGEGQWAYDLGFLLLGAALLAGGLAMARRAERG